MYGLPKIHKDGVPLRPIISYLGSTLYNLSSFLSKILNSFVGKTFSYIKNSEDFRNKIKNVVIPDNYILVSLDVVSLYTNVDINLVLDLVVKNWDEIKLKSDTKLDLNDFQEALNMIFNHNEFAINNEFYRQVFGCPMGSPASPSAANLVMEYIENEILKITTTTPSFYYRFVDDIITAIPKSDINSFLDTFNSFNPHLKFTIEIENDKKLPFLDLVIIRCEDGSLKTNWYHKNTWSGRYLSYNSWLPQTYKNNTAFLLAEKILKLSDDCFHEENFKILFQTLRKNGYPENIINQNIRKAMHKQNLPTITLTPPQNSVSANDSKKIVSVPYVKNLFEKIRTLLKPYNITVVGRACQNLESIFFSKLKVQIPKSLENNLIYQVNCGCGVAYVGETRQNLGKRIKQHVYHSTLPAQNSHSALSSHLRDKQHLITIDDTIILDKESNERKRLLLENAYIRKCPNSINIQAESNFLSHFYDNIL